MPTRRTPTPEESQNLAAGRRPGVAPPKIQHPEGVPEDGPMVSVFPLASCAAAMVCDLSEVVHPGSSSFKDANSTDPNSRGVQELSRVPKSRGSTTQDPAPLVCGDKGMRHLRGRASGFVILEGIPTRWNQTPEESQNLAAGRRPGVAPRKIQHPEGVPEDGRMVRVPLPSRECQPLNLFPGDARLGQQLRIQRLHEDFLLEQLQFAHHLRDRLLLGQSLLHHLGRLLVADMCVQGRGERG